MINHLVVNLITPYISPKKTRILCRRSQPKTGGLPGTPIRSPSSVAQSRARLHQLGPTSEQQQERRRDPAGGGQAYAQKASPQERRPPAGGGVHRQGPSRGRQHGQSGYQAVAEAQEKAGQEQSASDTRGSGTELHAGAGDEGAALRQCVRGHQLYQ